MPTSISCFRGKSVILLPKNERLKECLPSAPSTPTRNGKEKHIESSHHRSKTQGCSSIDWSLDLPADVRMLSPTVSQDETPLARSVLDAMVDAARFSRLLPVLTLGVVFAGTTTRVFLLPDLSLSMWFFLFDFIPSPFRAHTSCYLHFRPPPHYRCAQCNISVLALKK